MTGGTHAERIVALLSRHPGLDDDEIARRLGIEPRQTVNQVCRRLAAKGVLLRQPSVSGKIGNTLRHQVTARSVASAAGERPRELQVRGERPKGSAESSLVPRDLARTLIIIPCSGRKRDIAAGGGQSERITDHLPPPFASELREAREQVRNRVAFDETRLIPAWQRYDGSLYRSGRPALGRLLEADCHVAILSGGYGVVLAREPIGDYEAALNPAWWPNGVLQRVLIAYAKANGITAVRAFAARTTGYGKVLRKTGWREAGIDDALLISPEAATGAMRKSPASIGEALNAFSLGKLTEDWKSSYGLGLVCERSR